MKPSQFWWLQILNVALFVTITLLPNHEGPQTIVELILLVTAIFNNSMHLPETDSQKLTRTGIMFVLTAALIPFTWGRPMGWVVLLAFPVALYSFVKLLRQKLTVQTSLQN